MAGDVEGVGGEVKLVVGAGAVVGGEELTDDGVESGDADVAGVVVAGASPESVDLGAEVERVGHCLGLSVDGTFVLIIGENRPSGVQFVADTGIEWWSEQRSLEDVVGEIFVEIELENIEDRSDARRGLIAEEAVRRETVQAVADTGAMMLALPEDLVTRLGLSVVDSITTTYADGRRGELPVSDSLSIRIGDRRMATECIVVPEGAEPLVGVLVMERLDLVADPVNQTLGPRPESPDRPLLRV